MMNYLWGKGDEPDDSKTADNSSDAPINTFPTYHSPELAHLTESPHQSRSKHGLLHSPLSLADTELTETKPSTTDHSIDKEHLEWRTVIFIRHGNSIWNESTDNISIRNPYSAAKGFYAFTSGVKEYAKLKLNPNGYKHEDSIYVDTPLSPKGMQQAYNLSLFLKNHQSLREQQKLRYLQQHQAIASPLKDAWRCIEQFRIQQLKKKESVSSLCSDALSSMTDAMKVIESLMANAQPTDPEDALESESEILDDHDLNVPLDIAFILDILNGKNVPSKIVCSNLRRAISTCVLGLWNRLKDSTEKIYILSSLQEIGINVDTQTQTQEFTAPQLSNVEKSAVNLDGKALNEFYRDRIETIYNYGNKVNREQYLMESAHETSRRLEEFSKWVFMEEKEEQTDNGRRSPRRNGFKTVDRDQHVSPAVIATGHSAWIRAFFKEYLPGKSEFIGKKAKLANCGVVAFKFYCDKKNGGYGIAPNTICVVYKGFGVS